MPDSASAARLLEAILAASNEAIVSFTCDGTIQTWNEAAESLYGYAAEEMLGQLSRLLLLWDMSGHEPALRAPQSAQPTNFQWFERQHKNATKVRVLARRTPIRGEPGEVLGILESSHLETSSRR